MTLPTCVPRLGLCLFLGIIGSAGVSLAQVPQILNYQGRVAVNGVNYNGAGQFSFALVNPSGATTYWSNDGTSQAGQRPTNSVSVTVTNGLYSVLLGDTTLTNMTPVPASVFNNPDVRLRVWFNDGTHGFQQLTPDQRLAAVGYALNAGSINGVNVTGSGSLDVGTGGSLGSAAYTSSTNYVQTSNLGSGVYSALTNALNSINGLTTGSAINQQPLAQNSPNSPLFIFYGDSRTAVGANGNNARSFVSSLRSLGLDNNGNSSLSPNPNLNLLSTPLGGGPSKIFNLGMGGQTTLDGASQYYGAQGVPVTVAWTDATHGTITSSTRAAGNPISIGYTGNVVNGSTTINNLGISTSWGLLSNSIQGLCVGQTVYSSATGFPVATITAVQNSVQSYTNGGIAQTTVSITLSAPHTGPSGNLTFYASNLYQGAVVAGTGISPGATATWSGNQITLTQGSSSNGTGSSTIYWGGNAAGGNHITASASSYGTGVTSITLTGSTTGIVTGMVVAGPGIVPGTLVQVNGNRLNLISPNGTSCPTIGGSSNPTLDLTLPVRNATSANILFPEYYLGSAHQLSPAVSGNGNPANGNPAFLLDSYGINDTYQFSGRGLSPDISLAQEHLIFTYARADGYKIVSMTPYPVTNNAIYGFSSQLGISTYNALIANIKGDAYNATTNPNGWDYLFDVASLFPTTNNSSANGANVTQDSRWVSDGVHASDQGNALIAQYVANQFFAQNLLTQAGTFTPGPINSNSVSTSVSNVFNNGQIFANSDNGQIPVTIYQATSGGNNTALNITGAYGGPEAIAWNGGKGGTITGYNANLQLISGDSAGLSISAAGTSLSNSTTFTVGDFVFNVQDPFRPYQRINANGSQPWFVQNNNGTLGIGPALFNPAIQFLGSSNAPLGVEIPSGVYTQLDSLTPSTPLASDVNNRIVSTTESALLDTVASSPGSILYRGTNGWSAITPGATGTVLTSSGSSSQPIWSTSVSTTGLQIKEGGNTARMGVVTLSGGRATVANTTIAANTRIFLTVQSLGGISTPQAIAVTSRNPGVSFSITSASASDTSTVAWELIDPAP